MPAVSGPALGVRAAEPSEMPAIRCLRDLLNLVVEGDDSWNEASPRVAPRRAITDGRACMPEAVICLRICNYTEPGHQPAYGVEEAASRARASLVRWRPVQVRGSDKLGTGLPGALGA